MPSAAKDPQAQIFDMVIVGAGLSGIDMAYRLSTECPDKSFAILEGRDAIGGTWDLFRYPGIRSDSDMTTLGFPFRPWRGDDAIVDGPSIRDYIEDTAEAFDLKQHIRFGHKVVGAAWSSEAAEWTLDIEADGKPTRFRCRFLFVAAGYYDFAQGFTPEFEGREDFAGPIVHPQHWPQDLDYAGKTIVVIGSGATAITLIPSLLPEAAHVTMLQRSPTYVVSRPQQDRAAIALRRWLPAGFADWLVRWKNVLTGILIFQVSRRRPARVKDQIVAGVRQALGPGYDVDRHFTPRYNPWDQRICLVPDNDLFDAIRDGQASVVTDRIRRFTAGGIELESGDRLNADIIVTATGLNLRMMGGIDLSVDGQLASAAGRLVYKGMMLDGVPNFAFAFGYTNASWTLKCDLSARYTCRLINHMAAKGVQICRPVAKPGTPEEDLLDFSSGYVQRAANILPKQGAAAPWRVHQNYLLDTLDLSWKPLEDDAMRFEAAGAARVAA
ncbi:flavin-containing monooxygenase [Sphingopyxis sp. NJF-3]